MHATLPLLTPTRFPGIAREALTSLQVNLGYRCNQQCLHCHVNASPQRTEAMSLEVVKQVIAVLRKRAIKSLDLTGGAPEMNPHFRYLVTEAVQMGVRVLDRCNLTILNEPGYADLAPFLAANGVEIVASLPCYLEENVDAQRGKGVFARSIAGLRSLNALGYAKPESGLTLNLVYNPQGPTLPPAQMSLEPDYKVFLKNNYDIEFNHLYTLANMPIQRFGSTLVSKGKFEQYVDLLRAAHQESNIPGVMCRTLISVDWQGQLYDCDFNQMLGLPLRSVAKSTVHLQDLLQADFLGNKIQTADHCFGCTAGQGSSCSGALD